MKRCWTAMNWLSKDNSAWLLSACIRSMKPRRVHAAESNPAAATAQPSSAMCGHHPAGQRLVLLWFSWIMRFEAYGHCLMHYRLQFDNVWNWQSPLSSSYSLTNQNEVVYVHTEPQNFILGHSSWSRQQIHLPASLTSAQLTDQPQMSSSSGASVHAARRLASPTATKLRCPSTNRWLQTLLNIETLLSYWDL